MADKIPFEFLGIRELRFDAENPRLPNNIDKTSDKEIIEWMLNDASLVDLIASIAENNFFQGESIIVLKHNSEYIVIEGNRRLAAVKILNNPSLAKSYRSTIDGIVQIAKTKNHIPDRIPAYICKSRDEVQNYLGFRHVTGVKAWDVLAKSRFLYRIFENKNSNDSNIYREIAREIGSKAPYVKRLIFGYKLFLRIKSKRFYGINDLVNNEEDIDLSLLTDAATMNSEIAKWLNFDTDKLDPTKRVNEKNLELLTLWLYSRQNDGSTRIRETRDIKNFNKILKFPVAKDSFIKGSKSLTDALELTDVADENITVYISKSLSNLRDAQTIIHRAENPSVSDLNNLMEIKSIADLLFGLLNQRQTAKQPTKHN